MEPKISLIAGGVTETNPIIIVNKQTNKGGGGGGSLLDRDKTYFPFGKPGSGAPLTDSHTGKVKTVLNGNFLNDYYVSFFGIMNNYTI